MIEGKSQRLLTINQAAEKMAVSRQTIYAWIKGGQLTTHRTPGGRQRILEDSLLVGRTPVFIEDGSKNYEIIDIGNFQVLQTETSGLKEKFWIENKQQDWGLRAEGDKFLFKAGKEGTGENWAEIVVSGICDVMGLPHAEYKFARCREKYGVLTPNFVPDNARLTHGNEILRHTVIGYSTNLRYKQKKHTVSRVMGAIQESGLTIDWTKLPGIKDAPGLFVGYLLLDTLIANTDRHHENWGVIQDLLLRGNHLAPTFDHASSLGSHEKDDDKEDRLRTKDKFRNVYSYVRKARSALYEKQTDERAMYTIDAFKKAASFKPTEARLWLNQLNEIQEDTIDDMLSKIPSELMSEISKNFAKRILGENKRRLLELEL